MARALLLLAVLALLAAAWWLVGTTDDAAPPAPPADGTPSSAPADPVRSGAGAIAPGAASASPASANAQRSDARRPPEGLADRVTSWIQVVDEQQQPVAGAEIRRFHGGDDLTFTDERGRAGLPLLKPEQLSVHADGFLLRLAPAQVGTNEDLPQRVTLVRDTVSYRCRFRFVQPDGRPAPAVRVRFHPQKLDAAGDRARLRDASPMLARAWQEHTTIAALPWTADLKVQLGETNASYPHALTGEDEVRFTAGGIFTFEAATPDGLAARGTFAVAQVAAEPLEVALQPGLPVAGTVIDGRTKQPVAGAVVTVKGGDPLQLEARTDERGRFRLAPFAGGVLVLEVRSAEHEPKHSEPVGAGVQDVLVQLEPLPQVTLRGRVRSRPDLVPLAGATVVVPNPGGAPQQAVTGADGTFSLRCASSEVVRIVVTATDHLQYGELVEPGAPFLEIDLWPGTADARVKKQLTGVLAGYVVDERGVPMPGVPVRLQPERIDLPQGIAGRRVIDGGVLALPLVTTSREDGSFELETQCAGPGRLFAVDATSTAEDGIAVAVALGRAQRELKVPARRKP